MDSIETNWFVITGGPSSGKSKTLVRLSFMGENTVPESARIVIDEGLSQGKTLEEVRGDNLSFQHEILRMKLEREAEVLPSSRYFFDRGIPDSVPYMTQAGGDIEEVKRLSQKRRYKAVFLLDQLPFEYDYARTENQEKADEMYRLLKSAYEDLNYNVISVPVMPIFERAKFILEKAKQLI